MIAVGGVARVFAAGVEERHFFDALYREVYGFCVEHFSVWNVPASTEVVRMRFPDLRLVPETNDLDYLAQQFSEDRGVKYSIKAWMDIGTELDELEALPFGHPKRKQAVQVVMERARILAGEVPSSRASRLSDMASRLAMVKAQQDAGVVPGIKLGIPQVDVYVHRVRDTELVVFCGASGKGKTQLLTRCTIAGYEQDQNALFVGLEMEESEIWEMFDARVAELSRTAIARRELSKDDYERYARAAERMAAARHDIVVKDDLDGAPTIDKIAALVERHSPDILAVDYVSLLAADTGGKVSREESIALISRSLKMLARSRKIKVYVAAQNNRDAMVDGPTEHNIAFSQTIFNDCNIMVGVHQDGEMEKVGKVQLRLIKQRAGAKGPIGASGYSEFLEHWDRDMMVFEDWTGSHEWSMKLSQGGDGGGGASA